MANLGFMFVEVLYGYLTNSLGLISDAVHMIFDWLALLVGLIASYLAQVERKEGYSYGMSRIEVLSGFFNGVFLVFISFKILWESVDRIYEPQKIEENGLLTVSILGLLVNIVGLSWFHDLHHHDHGGEWGGHDHSHKQEAIKEKTNHSHHDHSHHDHSHHDHSHHDHSHHDHWDHEHSHEEDSHNDHSNCDHSHDDHSHNDHTHDDHSDCDHSHDDHSHHDHSDWDHSHDDHSHDDHSSWDHSHGDHSHHDHSYTYFQIKHIN